MRHDPVVSFGGLLDDLAADALVEGSNPLGGLRVLPDGAHDDAKRPLGEREAERAEQRMGAAPGDGAAKSAAGRTFTLPTSSTTCERSR